MKIKPNRIWAPFEGKRVLIKSNDWNNRLHEVLIWESSEDILWKEEFAYTLVEVLPFKEASRNDKDEQERTAEFS